jgi:hypothetical protein
MARKPIDRHMHPEMLLALIEGVLRFLSRAGSFVVCAIRLHSCIGFLPSQPIPRLYLAMSLAEIEKAIDELPPRELSKLAAYISRRDKLIWDRQIQEDFSRGGKHEKLLEKIDAEIDSGNFMPLP